MSKYSLRSRMLTAFLAVGLLPLAALALISISRSEHAVRKDVFNQLEAVQDIKKKQIETFFSDRQDDMGMLVETVNMLRDESMKKLTAVRDNKLNQVERYFRITEGQLVTFAENGMVVDAMRDLRTAYPRARQDAGVTNAEVAKMRSAVGSYFRDQFGKTYLQQSGQEAAVDAILADLSADAVNLQYQYIKANTHPLGEKHRLDRADDGSTYSRIHSRLHPTLRHYLETFGLYDIFLVDAETGAVVYTVFKEIDFATSLRDGPWADSGLGKCFAGAVSTSRGKTFITDYACYTPSYEAPACFVGTPVYDGDRKIGVAIVQLPLDQVNTIMAERAGLGQSGETYLVGADYLMRSDSFLDPDHHGVIASFRRPDTGRAETAAARSALEGRTGVGQIVGYNGNLVLSAYCPVEVGNHRWALLAEIDVAEAYSPRVEGAAEDYFARYIEMNDYYDLFLIDPDGQVFYTVAREADYQTNMITGPYAESGLGQLVQKVLVTNQYGVADFAPYAPSNGEPAAFVAQPIVNHGDVDVVVALQLSLDAINSVMQQREGMGESGETYLVGPDHHMRSDSYLDPENFSVAASFAGGKPASSPMIDAALAGKQGSRIGSNYTRAVTGKDNIVLSAYAPIQVGDATWAMVAEIAHDEAFSTSNSLKDIGMVIALVGMVAVISIALLVTRAVTRPVNQAIERLGTGADELASAADQVAQSSCDMSQGATEQAASLQEISAS